MKVSEKYKEIFRLKEMLEKAEIPFDFFELYKDMDWEHWHINYPHKGDFIISAIEGFGSYGEQDDKIEIMDRRTNDSCEVTGWLTAEDVFEIIKSHYEERK